MNGDEVVLATDAILEPLGEDIVAPSTDEIIISEQTTEVSILSDQSMELEVPVRVLSVIKGDENDNPFI